MADKLADDAVRWANVVLLLARRLLRRPNIKTTMVYCHMFAELADEWYDTSSTEFFIRYKYQYKGATIQFLGGGVVFLK